MFLLSILLIFAALTPRFASAAMVDDGREILLMINGKYVNYANPVYKDGRILIPLRAISNELGATVQFKGADQPIVIKTGKQTLQFTLGKKQASINGQAVKLDVPAQSIGNTTYVPVRLIADGLGVTVEANEPTKTVAIEAKHTAAQTKLSSETAKAIVQKELNDKTSLSALGTMYLHYYQFQAYNEYYEYEFYYLVDKYTGELYTWQLDRSLQNLTREHALNAVKAKIEPMVTSSINKAPEIWDYDSEATVKGKTYYTFDVCYVGPANPYYYITTVYATTNGAIAYMTDVKGNIIAFTENGFKERAKAAIK